MGGYIAVGTDMPAAASLLYKQQEQGQEGSGSGSERPTSGNEHTRRTATSGAPILAILTW